MKKICPLFVFDICVNCAFELETPFVLFACQIKIAHSLFATMPCVKFLVLKTGENIQGVFPNFLEPLNNWLLSLNGRSFSTSAKGRMMALFVFEMPISGVFPVEFSECRRIEGGF